MIYKKPIFEFNSVFAPYIRDYIELRESLGAKFRCQSGILRQFDRFCIEQGHDMPIIDAAIVNNWLMTKQGEKQETHGHRISALKCFAEHFRSVGGDVSWQPRPGYANRANNYVPYIFTEDELRRILHTADSMKEGRGSKFHLVFPAILKVLYCCGLRVSEALDLQVKDVDLVNGFVRVESSKFDNSRHLPISESLSETLAAYVNANCADVGIDPQGFFFPNARGEKYSQRTVYDKFRTILWQSGIPHQGKGKGPRVHDLRHSFAVHSLQKNISEGKDMYVALPILMSYLGHSKISTTEQYLRLTAEVHPDFIEIANTVGASIIPEVCDYEE